MGDSLSSYIFSYFLIALLCTSIGFKKLVWFFSIGYTISIIVFVAISVFYFRNHFSVIHYLQQVGLLFWGIRLGLFLWQREKIENYKNEIKPVMEKMQAIAFPIKISIWISVSILYVAMYAPAYFLITSQIEFGSVSIGALAGLIIMYSGIILEAIADQQKSNFKKNHSDQFCNSGLYSWVRFPNYLGEILVWTGNFLIAIAYYTGWGQWIIAVTGLLCLLFVMIGATKRLALKQHEKYGMDPSYQDYVKNVAMLFPRIFQSRKKIS